ncbi:MAG: signal recognition particle protein [Candidatus Melainabacteria bacterium]|nr:signal recognition particle protein [Candidatus Melainabacteria bacterium]
MFDQLTEKFQEIFKSLRGKSVINEENIEASILEVKRALIDADVSLKAIKTFTNKVREKAIGEAIIKGITPAQQFIKIINDELVALLGGKDVAVQRLNIEEKSKPSIILMLGLQGAGKTTTCAKLASLLKKKGRNPLLVALDLKRPAAIEQLKILGEQIGVLVYGISEDVRAYHGKPRQIAQDAINYAKQNNHDVVILDSAGRLQIDTELMAELLLIDRTIQPTEKLLVVDSMIGQEAANVGAAFNTQIGVTGIVLTKLDGDARGGAALSIVEEIQKPIKLIGTGEKIDDFQEFYPERMASRILGMGDVLTLVEKAQEKIQEDVAAFHETQLRGDFNFETFLQAQNMMGKLGSFSGVFNMMGMGGMLNQLGINMNKETQEKMLSENEVKTKKQKAMIQSMTGKERRNPNILTPARNRRIAHGSGHKEKDVEKLISEFKQMKKLMDQLKPFMQMFQGKNMSQDMLKNMMPGSIGKMQNPFMNPQSNMLKGFKPKKQK